jgi:hypothetical protein
MKERKPTYCLIQNLTLESAIASSEILLSWVRFLDEALSRDG